MKNIFKIYKKDIKTIFTNTSVAIITLGLIILPSLYAWFNIKASWDPYGSTNGIKVAIVNEDKGTTIADKNLNLGDKIVDELKKNTQLGWQFVNEAEAEKGLNSGKYYASITIPQDFSKDMSSIIDGDIKKGKLIYTVNEKINAISPKITDKGASSLADTITKSLVESVSGAIFEVFNEVGFELQEKLPLLRNLEGNLKNLQEKFNEIDTTVGDVTDISNNVRDVILNLQGNMDQIKSTLTAAKDLSQTINSSANQLKNFSNDMLPIIKNDLDLMISIANSINDLTNNVSNIGSVGKEEAIKTLNSIQAKLVSLKDLNNSIIKMLKTIDFIKPNTDLKPIINLLQDINGKIDIQINNITKAIESINNNGEIASDILNNINQVSKDISDGLTRVSNSYDSVIVPNITSALENIITISSNTQDLANSFEAELPKVESIMSSTLGVLDKGDVAIEDIKERLPKIYDFINNLVAKLNEVNSSSEVVEILKLLQQDPLLEKDFLASPVEIEENKLYPIPNYGSAMTPFYTVLSLWVGILLLLSIFSTETHGEYSDKEVYFGKLLLFLTLTTLQSLIVSLGDIFLLKAYVVNPVIFVLLNILTSMCFTLIVYSLVSVLGNVGKAVGVILLVLQVAGSGGTFPIEVTPKFFQIINPFLPFTYSISALRETVGGIYMPNLTRDIVCIVTFGLVFMLIAIFLKKPINKLTKGFSDKFNKSGLGAH